MDFDECPKIGSSNKIEFPFTHDECFDDIDIPYNWYIIGAKKSSIYHNMWFPSSHDEYFDDIDIPYTWYIIRGKKSSIYHNMWLKKGFPFYGFCWNSFAVLKVFGMLTFVHLLI